MSMTADPTTDQPQNDTGALPAGPFSDSLNAALDEVDRISQKRDAAAEALKAMPDDKDHQGQRTRAAQSLQQFENQLSIASRKVTEILRQQGQVAARPGVGGTPASPKSIPIVRQPNGVWTKDDTANPQADGSPGWRQATDATGTPLPGTATDRQVQDAIAQQNANTASRRADIAGQNADTAGRNADTAATNAATRSAVGDSQITRNDTQAAHVAALTPYQIADLQARGVLSQAQAQALTDKTPAQIDQMEARGELSNTQAAQIKQKMALALAPVDVSAPTGQPNIVQRNPATGDISSVPNPNYQPTDTAQRVTQLQNAARTKSNELQQAVSSGRTTPEQAAADFDAWWATNVDPFSQQLQQSQQTQQYDLQTKQREQQRLEEGQQTANLSTAQQAGRDVVSAYTSQDRNRVGPGYGQAFVNALNSWKTGKPAPDITPDAVMYQAPDLNQMYEQAVARSLAHISPTAARLAGQPMPQIPQGFDVAGALNKSNYAPKTTISPDGTVTIDHTPQQPTPAPAIPPYMMPDYTPAVAPF